MTEKKVSQPERERGRQSVRGADDRVISGQRYVPFLFAHGNRCFLIEGTPFFFYFTCRRTRVGLVCLGEGKWLRDEREEGEGLPNGGEHWQARRQGRQGQAGTKRWGRGRRV